jgi:hypothetical protein
MRLEGAELRDEKPRQLTAEFSKKRENFSYASILMHVTGFLIRDTEGSRLVRTHHTQSRHGEVQGQSENPDEITQCGRVGDKLTNGTIIRTEPLT